MHNLDRFIEAQEQAGTYDRAVAELRAGRKTSHWMWFVFPQLRGLGRSPMADEYGIGSLDEARAYLAHPVLGARLRECAQLLVGLRGTDAAAIFGAVDAIKLRSSMTLFHRAEPDEPLFSAVLGRYFAGEPDPLTERLLGSP